ncbi:MAG: DEAD/DEAH box helicase [Mariprofundaceae bacterium]|nr:DEAD/DEAH box helicase [Mariprofundaceae bacterium]
MPDDTSYDDLIKTLQGYPDAEQRAFYALAVIYVPITMTVLKELMKYMEWHEKFITTPWIMTAKKNSLLIPWDFRHQLHPDILEFAMQKMVLSGDYPKLIQWVTKPSNQDYKYREQFKKLLLRKALYDNDFSQIRKVIKDSNPAFTPLDPFPTVINSIFYAPHNEAWFTTLTAELQFQLLYQMTELTLKFQTMPLLLPEIAKRLDQSEAIMAHAEGQCLRASIAMWQGDIELMKTLIPDVPTERACALRGRLAFLYGRDDEAFEHYKLTIDIKKQSLKKRLVCLTGEDAIFHLFLCLRSKNMKLFYSSVNDIQKHSNNEMIVQLALFFSWVLKVHEQQETLNTKTLDDHINMLPNVFFAHLCALFGIRWLKEKLLINYFSSNLTNNSFLKRNKMFWYYWEIIQVFENMKMKAIPKDDPFSAVWKKKSDQLQALGIVSCTKIIKEEAKWERSLRALNALMSPESSESLADRKQRLVWLFQATKGKKGTYKLSESLEVRLQVLSKKGTWSKGRKVALTHLLQSSKRSESYPWLSAQDQAICNHIQEHEVNESRYYYYYETVIDVNAHDILPDAVDHSALFIGDLNTPFHIEEGQVTLQVVQERKNICIKIIPFPNNEDMKDDMLSATVMFWETPQRMVFYRFNQEQLRIVRILGKAGLSVPEEAKERALESITAIAPLLTVHSEIGGGGQQAAKDIVGDSRLHLHLQPIGDGLQVSCFVRPFADAAPMLTHPGEGGKTLFTEHDGETLQTQRNLKAETKLSQKMFNKCTHLDAQEGWNWQLDEPQQALETLEQLQELGKEAVLEWPEGKGIKLVQKMETKQFGVSIHKHQDWFQLEGEIQLGDDDVMGVKQLLSLVEGSSGRFIRMGDDQFISLSQALYKRLQRLQKITDGGRFHNLAASAIDDVTQGMNVRKNKSWQDHLQKISDAEAYEPVLPSTLQAELRDYQVEGFNWMARLTHWGAGACLADDMGLGKTVQALALLLTLAQKGPALIIAPTSVCMNWEAEVIRFAPSLRLHNFAEGERAAMVADAGAFDVVVCSYALLQRNGTLLASREWQMIVLDEAQAIKNASTKRSQAAMALQSPVRIITTGTPIENHLGELWTLFQFINPGLLGSLERFNQRFANPIQIQHNTEVAQHLKQLVHPFILRRLKSNVLTELPSRTEITIHVELPKEEMALYEAVRQQALERIENIANGPPGARQIQVLAEIMRLRRVCCHPSLVMPDTSIVGAKLTAFGECIKELRDGKHKALVFSQFIGHLDILRRYLDQEKIHYQYLDGSTPVKQRKKRVDAFQAGEGDVFLISLKAGGSGLNLTAADYVLHMDPWWNPAVEDQASDRAHRMGQKRPVTIYRFIAKNTIEDKIVQMHQQKRDLADTLLEGSDAGGKLSLAAIMKLVEASSIEG